MDGTPDIDEDDAIHVSTRTYVCDHHRLGIFYGINFAGGVQWWAFIIEYFISRKTRNYTDNESQNDFAVNNGRLRVILLLHVQVSTQVLFEIPITILTTLSFP